MAILCDQSYIELGPKLQQHRQPHQRYHGVLQQHPPREPALELLERAINQRILPPNLVFAFAAQDSEEEREQAELDAKYLSQAEQLLRRVQVQLAFHEFVQDSPDLPIQITRGGGDLGRRLPLRGSEGIGGRHRRRRRTRWDPRSSRPSIPRP